MATMKLRLRSLESRETLRITVPDPCTLQDLKDALLQSLTSTSSPPRLSLNRKDELHASSPEDSLRYLGITSGDLIFYTFNSSAISSPQPRAQEIEGRETLFHTSDLHFEKPKLENSEVIEESQIPGSERVIEEDEANLASNPERQGPERFAEVESMDVDDQSAAVMEKKDLYVPLFMKRVLREELGNDRNAYTLLVIAVHAVLLESGFITIDSVSGKECNRFHIPNEWPSSSFTMSLFYTLPEILSNSSTTQTILVKFQSLGHFINVYGSLVNNNNNSNNSSVLHKVCLSKNEYAPTLGVVWASSGSDNRTVVDDDNVSSEKQLFSLWKTVKDELALPLLTNLCESAGLPSPACFMLLPADIKMKILELLHAVDIARVGCVCTEMRYLCYNSDLWNMKCVEEFGMKRVKGEETRWRERFAWFWEQKKDLEQDIVASRRSYHNRGEMPFFYPMRPSIRNTFPYGAHPRIVGGDYDILPGMGVPPRIGQYRRNSRGRARGFQPFR